MCTQHAEVQGAQIQVWLRVMWRAKELTGKGTEGGSPKTDRWEPHGQGPS